MKISDEEKADRLAKKTLKRLLKRKRKEEIKLIVTQTTIKDLDSKILRILCDLAGFD